MLFNGLDKFCGSEFWNASVTWNTTNPDFTECFEKTVLVWVPCVFLWMFSPMEIYSILHSMHKDIPWTQLNISKLVFYAVIILHCIADLGYTLIGVTSQAEVYAVDIFSPVVKILTFGLAIIFTLCNKAQGIQASGLQFLFCMLLVVCGLPQFHTYLQHLIEAKSEVTLLQNISYFVYYTAVVMLFVLNFFADAAPRYSELPVCENPCPEKSVSVPSKLTFSWFEKLAMMGFRRPLETRDLWHMNYDDTAAGIMPVFDKYWNASVQKAAVNTNIRSSYYSSSTDIIGNGEAGSSRHVYYASILPALCKTFGPTFAFGAFLRLLQDLLSFVSPQILKLLIAFVSGKESMWRGYLYAVLLLVAPTCQTILASQFFYKVLLVGLRVRTALISAIYRKTMRRALLDTL